MSERVWPKLCFIIFVLVPWFFTVFDFAANHSSDDDVDAEFSWGTFPTTEFFEISKYSWLDTISGTRTPQFTEFVISTNFRTLTLNSNKLFSRATRMDEVLHLQSLSSLLGKIRSICFVFSSKEPLIQTCLAFLPRVSLCCQRHFHPSKSSHSYPISSHSGRRSFSVRRSRWPSSDRRSFAVSLSEHRWLSSPLHFFRRNLDMRIRLHRHSPQR